MVFSEAHAWQLVLPLYIIKLLLGNHFQSLNIAQILIKSELAVYLKLYNLSSIQNLSFVIAIVRLFQTLGLFIVSAMKMLPKMINICRENTVCSHLTRDV